MPAPMKDVDEDYPCLVTGRSTFEATPLRKTLRRLLVWRKLLTTMRPPWFQDLMLPSYSLGRVFAEFFGSLARTDAMEIERSGEQQSDLDERVTKTQNTDNNYDNRQNRFDVAVIQRGCSHVKFCLSG